MSKLFAYELSRRRAAITWPEALGFETTTRQQDDGGASVHAVAGSSVFAPEETEWGTERAGVLDLKRTEFRTLRMIMLEGG
jgi:hypothetical protein